MDHNPLTQPFNTPYGAVPFDKITVETYEPAFKEGIKAHEKEINNIINDPNTPTFDNTIVAMEHSGSMLNQIAHVFFAMLSADATQELNDVATKIIPILTEHETNIILNEKLWQRVKYVKENIDSEELDAEDKMLLNKAYKALVRNGANLNEEQKKRFRELTKRLSEITHLFSQNLLKATSQFEMWLDEGDLEGLPQRAINMAKQAAQNKGNNDKYLINLSAPSYRDFMKYSSRRDLREKLYKAYNSKCVDGELSNIKILVEIATIRLNLAQLLGYESFAHYQLEETMATDITHVMQLLNNLKDAYMPAQVKEIEEVTKFASKQDPSITKLMPWDYSYYYFKLRKQLFDYDDEQLRPYFPLNNVIDGVFALATKLYSITFKQTENVPVFNPKVKVYEVNDSDGSFLGLLYCDFFPRDTKQSGAWMTSFKQQHGDLRPHVTLTMNFTPPTQQQQSLLSLGEVRTFLHEFGHALHSLFSKCKYESLSGTSVYRDFVELPSQFNENFIFETEFLNSFAFHYETGEPLPEELIQKVKNAAQFGAGYDCMRQLFFGFLDMAWHTLQQPISTTVEQFEHDATSQVKIFDDIDNCLISPQFSHIFAGGYAAGYYGYKWAEVLDADIFQRFKNDGIFNKETANLFRQEILQRGGTEHPMTLYKNFMHREPTIDALLQRDGITNGKAS